MRRSEALTITVMCPHLERPVIATRNAAADRLVDCREKAGCVTIKLTERGNELQVFPAGCAVFRERTDG